MQGRPVPYGLVIEEILLLDICHLYTWNGTHQILGLWFTNDLKDCHVVNFHQKFSEIRALYKVWLKRQIMPLGSVAVLKSLI